MTNNIRTGYKILTHDWKPPIQGGEPLCNGILPITLPTVKLDKGQDECSYGYNYTGSLATAAKIAGFWPTGWPSKCLVVSSSKDAIERGNKRRCSQITLERLCTLEEIQGAMRDLVMPWAKDHIEALVNEQWLWYVALGRPQHDKVVVESCLQLALEARNLKWTIKEFPDARAAWAAWAAWAARNAWAARDAWAAWDALTVYTAANIFDFDSPENLLTLGIRDAYLNGLAIALPTGPQELGWAMVEGDTP